LRDLTDLIFTVLPLETLPSFQRFTSGTEMEIAEFKVFCALVAMLSTIAPLNVIIPSIICASIDSLLDHLGGSDFYGDDFFNRPMRKMRYFCPEVRNLISVSMYCHINVDGKKYLPDDINSLLRYIVRRISSLDTVEAEEVSVQSGTYNPAKYGRAYYLSPTGCKPRNRQFSIDKGNDAKNRLADDDPIQFEACHK